MRLPRSRKEFVLFMMVISIISVNIIAPTITCMEVGFTFENYLHTLQVIPVVWVAVIACVLITYRPAGFLTSKMTAQGDSFRSCITINILCTVFLMSIILTIVGAWIGNWAVTMEPIEMFIYRWPRNFGIALGVELLIAQPIAREVMNRFHIWKDSKAGYAV